MPELADFDVARVRAGDPGPFTLSGTNTWLLGRDPAWVVDPGPALPEHLEAVVAEAARRGGVGGIALTHGHADHAGGTAGLRERTAARPRGAADREPPVGAASRRADVRLADGDTFGPFLAVSTPGHAPDHLAYVAGAVCFSGDVVLGEGSVLVAPDPAAPGALGRYLAALGRLREHDLALICPGHGPPVWDPAAKLDEYVAHRQERERRLAAALEGGLRRAGELLDAVWDDAPPALRPAAAITLAAHLDKLGAEGRLPEGVERPDLSGLPGEP